MFLYLCICLFVCTVACMHNVHTAHIFIVYNSMIYIKSFNILSILYNGHITLNYAGRFLYFIYIGYILLSVQSLLWVIGM